MYFRKQYNNEIMARFELKLPKMGESVAEATITSWLKEVGDTIELDEAIVEIATDKVDSEVPSEVEGTLVEILFHKNDVELNVLQEYFLTIGMAKVSTSAHEAYDLGILEKGKDIVVVNKDRQIAVAKAVAKSMADLGYTKPVERKDVKVLGKQALGMFLVGTDSMEASNFISEHDQKIANKLAYVMAGGDLSEPTLVTEQYLLDIEREAFLSLCSERKTLERIEHMLKTGKPLRN